MQNSSMHARTAAAFAAIGMMVRIDDTTIKCPRTGIIEMLPKTTATDAEIAALARSLQDRATSRMRFLVQARDELEALAERAACRCTGATRVDVRVGADSNRLVIVLVYGAGREAELAEADRRLAFGEDGSVLPAAACQLRRAIAQQMRAA